jgi:hypothetical protein
MVEGLELSEHDDLPSMLEEYREETLLPVQPLERLPFEGALQGAQITIGRHGAPIVTVSHLRNDLVERLARGRDELRVLQYRRPTDSERL